MTTKRDRPAPNLMPLTLTIDDIEAITNYKRETLEKVLLHDPRILQWQRRAAEGGKRVWLAEETYKAIKEIMLSDWVN